VQSIFGPGEQNRHVISDFSYQALRIKSGAEEEYTRLSRESIALLDGFTKSSLIHLIRLQHRQHRATTIVAPTTMRCISHWPELLTYWIQWVLPLMRHWAACSTCTRPVECHRAALLKNKARKLPNTVPLASLMVDSMPLVRLDNPLLKTLCFRVSVKIV